MRARSLVLVLAAVEIGGARAGAAPETTAQGVPSSGEPGSAGISAGEPSVAPAKRFALGLRAEPFLPLGSPLGAGLGLALSGNYQLSPVGPGSLFWGGSVGYAFGGAADRSYSVTTGGATLLFDASLARTALPLLAEGSFSVPLNALFVFGRVGLGAAWFDEVMAVTYRLSGATQEIRETGWGFAWALAAGVALPAGPGAFSAALRFSYGAPGFRAAGANVLGGLGLELGYRLPLL